MTLRSDLTTELEKALTDEAYDGGSGALSPAEFSRLVRRLAETAAAVVAEAMVPVSDLEAAWRVGARHASRADAAEKALAALAEPQGEPSDARVEAASRRLFGATVDSMDRARELARIALTAPPLVACPHWAPGKITFRNGCTACAASSAVTEQGGAR